MNLPLAGISADFFIKIFKKILPNTQSVLSQKMQESPNKVIETLGEMLETPELKAQIEREIQDKISFMQNYEGAMSDLTEWGKNLRSSVRPILTYFFSGIYLIICTTGALFALLNFQIETVRQAYNWLAETKFIFFTGIIICWWFFDRSMQRFLGRL